MATPDFIDLARAADPRDIDAMNRLWAAAFSLPAWLFLMTPKSAATMQPSVQSIDDKAWMLAFTDSGLLRNYAEQNRNLDAAGQALYLSLEPAKALPFLAQFQGGEVFGVRFNERAAHGWFSPLANLPQIHAFLIKKGFLQA